MQNRSLLSELEMEQLQQLDMVPDMTGESLERIQKRVRAGIAEKPRRHWRLPVLIVAAAALTAGCVVAGASYQKWNLPAAQTYTGALYSQQGEPSSYHMSDISSTPPESLAPQSDEALIQAGFALFEQLGVSVQDPQAITVTRRFHQGYQRNEVVVAYGSNVIEAKFNADTGALIGATRFIFDEDGVPCADVSEAEACATRFYEALPVPQGYELCGCDQYDEDYWTFQFARRTPLGVLSAYEAVKVSINPLNGAFLHCVVFSTPLLDDHAEGDVPLTEADAIQIGAEKLQAIASDGYWTLTAATLAVVSPNYMFTDVMDSAASTDVTDSVGSTDVSIELGHLRYADVTRYAYVLRYHGPENELFESAMELYIDLYTGELLGGDMMK